MLGGFLSHATAIAVYFLATAGETSVRRTTRQRERDASVENIPPRCAPNTPDAPQQLISTSFKRSRAVFYTEVCTTEGPEQRDGERLLEVNRVLSALCSLGFRASHQRGASTNPKTATETLLGS